MKTFTARKIVAIFTAVSLAFLQAVPAGVAATNPEDLIPSTGVPTSEKSATSASAETNSVKENTLLTTIDTLMDTGGIVRSDASGQEVTSSAVDETVIDEDPSEYLTNEELQAQIDQLLEAARLLEERAVAQVERASALSEQAAKMRQMAERMIATAQEQARIAQSLTRQGQTLLLAAEKEMAALTAREKKARAELAAYKKMKPSRAVQMRIAALTAELNALAKQRSATMRKMTQAKSILQDAQKRQQSASAMRAQGERQLRASNDLLKQSASLQAQGRAMRAQAAAKVAEANELKSRMIPPVVQEYVDALKAKLGGGFLVEADLQADGTYRVHIAKINTCPAGAACVLPSGAFSSLEFSLTAEGDLNRDFIKANYNGIEVDGKLLFEVMAALEASFHPEGSAWMPPPPYYTARLVELAAQIIVKESDENLLHFDHSGTSYKAYRDAEGNVVLEKELPPAVQVFVDALTEALPGMEITVAIERTSVGAQYRVKINSCSEGTPCTTLYGGFGSMDFALDSEGKLNSGEIHVFYKGFEKVDGQLLFEAMGVCPEGQVCTLQVMSDVEKLAKMTQVNVTKVEDSAIFYMWGDKNYKCYRDAEENVKVEAIPPVVQIPPDDDETAGYRWDSMTWDAIHQIRTYTRTVSFNQADDLEITKTIDSQGVTTYRARILGPNSSVALSVVLSNGKTLVLDFILTGRGEWLDSPSNGQPSFKAATVDGMEVEFLLADREELDSKFIMRGNIPSEDYGVLYEKQTLYFEYGGALKSDELAFQALNAEGVREDVPFYFQIGLFAEDGTLKGLGGHRKLEDGTTLTYDHALTDEWGWMGNFYVYYSDYQEMGGAFNLTGTAVEYDLNGMLKRMTGGGHYVNISRDGVEIDGLRHFLPDVGGFPEIYAPSEAMVFPATLRHYDAEDTLIRQIEMDAEGKIVSVASYVQGRDQEIPARVVVYPQGSDAPYSEMQYDAQGRLLSVAMYRGDSVQLPPQLQAPAGAVIFPSTLKHYDSQGVLLREITMDAEGKIVSVASYVQGRDQEIPARVEVYPQGSDQLHAVLIYNAEGQLVSMTEYQSILPQDVLQAAQPNLTSAELSQLNAAMLDVGLDSQLSIQIGENGSKSWSWVSANGVTTYVLKEDHFMIQLRGDPETYEEQIRWSFEARSSVPASEVPTQGANLDPATQQELINALSQAVAQGRKITQVVRGSDVSYQWADALDASVLCVVSLRTTPAGTELAFSKQMSLVPQGLAHLGENLSDPAQQTQFNAAIEDVAPLTRENFEALLRRTTDAKGRVIAWAWTSANGIRDYFLSNQKITLHNPDGSYKEVEVWSFSSQEKVGVEELQAQADQLAAEERDAFNRAIGNTFQGTVFTKIVSGNDVSYQWSDPSSSERIYGIVIYGTHVSFYIQERILTDLLARSLRAQLVF